jgi:gluconolactonase
LIAASAERIEIFIMMKIRHLLFLGGLMTLSHPFPSLHAADDYTHGPDSQKQEGVPAGTVEKLELGVSQIFPGTRRDAWIYVPSQYRAEKPACVMVFQDGEWYHPAEGQWRVPVVFDNLIHRGEMPVTIALFINPGVVPATDENALPRYNRSFEYDGLGDRYARFIAEEVFPTVQKKWNLSQNPDDRAIGGASSGAVCAFTAAWERPDLFRRVFSTIGTYVGLRGANDYVTLIRKTEPKPLRIFLQDGSADLNIYGGDWWMVNQEMQRALTFSGYDVAHEWGDGGHNGKHGSAILPQAMKWLWRDHGQPLRANPQGTSKQPVAQWVDLTQTWKKIETATAVTDLSATPSGDLLFLSDGQQIKKITGLETVSPVTTAPDRTLVALSAGPADEIYTLSTARGLEKWTSPYTSATVVKNDLTDTAGQLTITADGTLFITQPTTRRVWSVNSTGTARVVIDQDSHLTRPQAVATSTDQSLVYVADTWGVFAHSFQRQKDGSLAHPQPYYHFHEKDNAHSLVTDLAVDQDGRLYASSPLGVQICDQAGRVNAIVTLPTLSAPTSLAFGSGAEKNHLYLSSDGQLYVRPLKVKGTAPAQPASKPAAPRL